MTTNEYRLSEDQEKWVRARTARYRLPRELLRNIIRKQRGCCAWSSVPMRFDTSSLTPPTDHIAAVLDHSSPGSDADGHHIVCHYLNDTKGKMPRYLFEALRRTPEWQKAMLRMIDQFKRDPGDSDSIINSFKNDTGSTGLCTNS